MLCLCVCVLVFAFVCLRVFVCTFLVTSSLSTVLHSADTGTDQKMRGPKLTRRGRADSCRVGPGTEEHVKAKLTSGSSAEGKNVRRRTREKREQVWERTGNRYEQAWTSCGSQKKGRATASNGWSVAFHGVDDAADWIFPDEGDDEL